MDALNLHACDPADPDIRALIDLHFDLMRSQSPPESCHVLPADGLAGTYMLAAHERDTVLGIGALAVLEPGHGEIKSMHTRAAARGRGVAQAILLGLLEEASRRGITRVSLETGSAETFAPARRLYARAGFTECAPFGAYQSDPLSVFMTRTI